MDAMSIFSDNVMALLAKKGWSIQELADRCEMDRSNLSKVLRAKEGCTLARAAVIAEQLGVPLARLVEEHSKILSKVS
jgi:transcriptional regulator with XRE-family HTH domain